MVEALRYVVCIFLHEQFYTLMSSQGAYALTYVLYSLANNPEKQDLLATEAKRLLGHSGGKVRMKPTMFSLARKWIKQYN